MDASGPRPGTVAVVGSLNADLTVHTATLPRPGETVTGGELAINPGGKSANQAAAIGRLGGSVRLLGRVGDDPHGDLLLDRARRAGVQVDSVQRLSAVATGTAVILVDDSAENVIVVSPGANGRLSADDVRAAAAFFDGAAVACLCLEIPSDTVAAAARAARDAGAMVVLNLSPYRTVPTTLLDLVDVLVVNEHELRLLLDEHAGSGRSPDLSADGGPLVAGDSVTGPQIAAEVLATLGVPAAVVTLGASGSIVLQGDALPARVAAVPVTAVDTTGSGDAFTGALAMQLAAGASLTDAATFASRVGAYAATGRGAQTSYPSLEDLQRPPATWGSGRH